MSAKLHCTSSATLEAFREARRTHGDHFVDQAIRAADAGLQPAPYLIIDESEPSRKLFVVFPDSLFSGSSGMSSSSPS